MRRPLALAGVTLAGLAASAAIAAAPAFAATPVAGTTACTDVVNVDGTVENALTTLNNAKSALATAQENGTVTATLTDAVTQAQSAYNTTVANTTAADCTTASSSTTSTTTASPAVPHYPGYAPGVTPFVPATPGTVPPVVNVPSVASTSTLDDEIDALNCSTSNTTLQSIDREIVARQAAHLTTAKVNARLNAKLAGLACTGTSAVTPAAAAQTAAACGCSTAVTTPTTTTTVPSGSVVTYGATPAKVTTATVSPTASDGSTATTSGSEIAAANVPTGSASTGAE